MRKSYSLRVGPQAVAHLTSVSRGGLTMFLHIPMTFPNALLVYSAWIALLGSMLKTQSKALRIIAFLVAIAIIAISC